MSLNVNISPVLSLCILVYAFALPAMSLLVFISLITMFLSILFITTCAVPSEPHLLQAMKSQLLLTLLPLCMSSTQAVRIDHLLSLGQSTGE